MSNFLVYLKWYLCLNGVLYFKSNTDHFENKGILTIFNNPNQKVIKEIYFYYKRDNKIFYIRKGLSSSLFEERLALIDPSITKGDLDKCIYQNHISFLLTSKDKSKYQILEEHYLRLSTSYPLHHIVLLGESESQNIFNYFLKNTFYDLNLKIKFHTPIIQKFYILTCLTSICLSILTIFYLVCGIYSSKNPIVTEFELNRFQVIEYKDLLEDKMESCLICFDTFKEEDHIRILLCKHYFHKECVDKWLCEQSSRCPYCRCTNKYYDELI
ncbi:RING finger protein 148 [Nosema bombycis CQ1]|uniref:RING finger protein 148 n=1 Tax=Nosema bombycis (strain CQ1 / CVCC 102059) TaxID=578461 RepID=R0KVC1_NOSB1|nr:RING finger protein 148 [Nosema bombycis CQ1]|eukprot:EOB14167.1 RING finger protein 148 [Nosema bombycis CQ1]